MKDRYSSLHDLIPDPDEEEIEEKVNRRTSKVPGVNAALPKGEDPIYRRPSSNWDKEHASLLRTYRGIPPEVDGQITRIAHRLGVPKGEVARAIMESGLKDYTTGKLKLNPKLYNGRRTLFPPAKSKDSLDDDE